MARPPAHARPRSDRLTGWGRTTPSVATVGPSRTGVSGAPSARRGMIARGLGRSYGDAAQNGGGLVVGAPDGPVALDESTGIVTAAGGTSFDALLRTLVPRGWFLPVAPGTRFVTVGGAVAADVHGKNHHVDGAFGAHVLSIDLRTADGVVRSLRRDADDADDRDLWVATLGGMGLTGVIERVMFRAMRIETAWCEVRTERVADLDALLRRIDETGDARYSVAWVDLLATGSKLGRSVLTTGDHATVDRLRALDPRRADDPLEYSPRAIAAVPSGFPNVLRRPVVVRFNAAWFRRAPLDAVAAVSIPGFFHPLDALGSWNRLYGRGGMVQYQFVVPPERTDALAEVAERISGSGQPSCLGVLKRFGPAGDGLLSFPRPGWTLAVDLPAGASGVSALFHDLDRIVIRAGGRHYLAKDAVARPVVIAAGYPELDRWRAIRDRFDPGGMWRSDLARRLDLIPRADGWRHDP